MNFAWCDERKYLLKQAVNYFVILIEKFIFSPNKTIVAVHDVASFG